MALIFFQMRDLFNFVVKYMRKKEAVVVDLEVIINTPIVLELKNLLLDIDGGEKIGNLEAIFSNCQSFVSIQN